MSNDVSLLECFNRIRYAQEMEPFRKYLVTERDKLREQLETMPVDKLQLLQGNAQRISTILGLIESAPERLEQLRVSR